MSGTSCDPPNLLSLLQDSHSTLETHGLNLGCSLIDFLGLLLGDTLDVEHLLLGAAKDLIRAFRLTT